MLAFVLSLSAASATRTPQTAVSAYPAWRTMPAKLGTLVERLQPASRGFRQITPDDCATARAAGYTQTDVEIAADVPLAADVVLEAIPSDTIAEVVRVIAVAVWAIPQGVLRGFEHLYNIASACDDADQQALATENLDAKVSTRSSQTSLNTLTTNFNTFNTNFNTLSTLVNSRLDVAVSTRATQLSLDTFNNQFTANATVVNTKLDSITTSLTSANTKFDNLAIAVGNNGALDLRLKIEEDLSQPGAHPIALFEVRPPAAATSTSRVRSRPTRSRRCRR